MRIYFVFLLLFFSIIDIKAQNNGDNLRIEVFSPQQKESRAFESHFRIKGRIISTDTIAQSTISVNEIKHKLEINPAGMFNELVSLTKARNRILVEVTTVNGKSASYELFIEYIKAMSSNSKFPVFPWPPPKPSAFEVIPSDFFKLCHTFEHVNEKLLRTLYLNGYTDKSYYLVMPEDSVVGFAIATRLEQINEDGSSKNGSNRWVTKVEMNDFTFSEYISSLFFKQVGYFRVIVFIITDEPIKMGKTSVKRETALSWVSSGADRLPHQLRNRYFSDKHTVTALIYEYKMPENSDKAVLNKPSKHTAREHLVKSNLWNVIKELN